MITQGEIDLGIVEPTETLRDRTGRMECAHLIAEWAATSFDEPARSAILHDVEHRIMGSSPRVAWREIERYGRLMRAADLVASSPELRALVAVGA